MRAHEQAHAEDIEATSPGVCSGADEGAALVPDNHTQFVNSEKKACAAEKACLNGKHCHGALSTSEWEDRLFDLAVDPNSSCLGL